MTVGELNVTDEAVELVRGMRVKIKKEHTRPGKVKGRSKHQVLTHFTWMQIREGLPKACAVFLVLLAIFLVWSILAGDTEVDTSRVESLYSVLVQAFLAFVAIVISIFAFMFERFHTQATSAYVNSVNAVEALFSEGTKHQHSLKIGDEIDSKLWLLVFHKILDQQIVDKKASLTDSVMKEKRSMLRNAHVSVGYASYQNRLAKMLPFEVFVTVIPFLILIAVSLFLLVAPAEFVNWVTLRTEVLNRPFSLHPHLLVASGAIVSLGVFAAFAKHLFAEIAKEDRPAWVSESYDIIPEVSEDEITEVARMLQVRR